MSRNPDSIEILAFVNECMHGSGVLSLEPARMGTMPRRSVTYRVLIASPSDLADERQAATEIVYEWNAQHATAESVVLLPVKWGDACRTAIGSSAAGRDQPPTRLR
jgi:hypothetical protein